ncbi:MAG TPA: YbgA family protein, partial [Erysipelotrichaceae bacterium]|nr:YbgA family protein [Erysipelotrichaceae bacterium]
NLGNIVANHKNLPYKEVLALYKHHLGLALLNPPTTKNITNTLMHLLGYFSKDLIREEKEFLLENLEKIKNEKIHIGVPVGLMKSYAIKYKQDYILNQVIWEPFPDELLNIKDSGS